MNIAKGLVTSCVSDFLLSEYKWAQRADENGWPSEEAINRAADEKIGGEKIHYFFSSIIILRSNKG
jgi:hypothetical protein